VEPAHANPGAAEDLSGQRVGRYKLLERIGEGGFGMVYMAEQLEPVQRKVAFKIIKAGMDSHQIIARFEAERQALALMDHPNIAKVLDAGTTDAGRPYFVMELVRGMAVTSYCDEARLPTPERLRLFIRVCQAVQHAHQKGIIHRDLKPSNVLVTLHDGEPVPKVIDFGIAKALGQKLTDKTLFTGFTQMLGTPAYMSPEQAELSGLDIDTRSDIYSLGVLLYELLTGVTPFDKETFARAALDEIRRLIRETDPPKPSTRLETMGARATDIARRRRTEPAALRRSVSGDLDWIVMKCLEKSRQRRYDSATNLAADLERYLNHEPVSAAAPSLAYRAGRFARRHRVALITTGAFILLLVGGAAASMWEAFRARAAERRAHMEANKSKQVAELLESMLEGVGPSKARGRDTAMLREILDNTAARLGKDFANQPEVEIALCQILSKTYKDLGLNPQQFETAKRSLQLCRSFYGENHAAFANALWFMGCAQHAFGQLSDAEGSLRQAITLQRKLLGPESEELALSLTELATVLWRGQRSAEADAAAREALAIYRKHRTSDDPEIARLLGHLATTAIGRRQFDQAETMQRQELEIERRLLGADSPQVATTLGNLAFTLEAKGNLREAETNFNEALKVARKSASEHRSIASLLRNLATVLRFQGRLFEAEAMHRQALDMRRKLLPADHPDLADSLNALGVVLGQERNEVCAEPYFREALDIRRGHFGLAGIECVPSAVSVVNCLIRLNKLPEAESLACELLEALESANPSHWHTAKARCLLGSILYLEGRFADAEPLLALGYQGLTQAKPEVGFDPRPNLIEAASDLLSVYQALGRTNDVDQWRRELANLSPGTSHSSAPPSTNSPSH
jgi:tetratricopeptide (TPR) repeat protein